MAPTQDTYNRVKAVMDKYGVPPIVWYPIMMAESAGIPDNDNVVDLNGVSSVGLFQLNLKGQGAGYTVAQLHDIELNSEISAKHFKAAMDAIGSKYPDSLIAAEVAIRSGHPGGFANTPYYGNGMELYNAIKAQAAKGIPTSFDTSSPSSGSSTADIQEPSSNPITQTADTLSTVSAMLSYLGVNAATIFARGVLVTLAIPIILIGAYLLVKAWGLNDVYKNQRTSNMRSQDALSITRPTGMWNIAHDTDTLYVMNWTPYAMYVRVGDNIQAGPSSYHYCVPPSAAMTIPCKARDFSAALDMTILIPYLSGLVQRADIIFSAGEEAPMVSHLDLPKNFDMGFNSVYSYRSFELNVAAGTHAYFLPSTPAGYGLVLQNVWAQNVDTACRIILQLSVAGATHMLRDIPVSVPDLYYSENSVHIISFPDSARVVFTGCALGDDLNWGASGYYFKTT